MRISGLHLICCLAGPIVITACYSAGDTRQANGDGSGQPIGAIEFSSSHDRLTTGFAWAKGQALGYVFDGDPVGAWYEAALPGREAFCMRDVSHQATGALALGLAEHTKNMLRKFARGIAESRDWCSYWEINRYDEPAPVDYRSDDDFWYNLPANFDVIDACYRAHEWTSDDDYLHDTDFRDYYRLSLTEYVKAWDPDEDGIMESPASAGIRGIPTYWEGEGPRARTGGDLVAAQFAANLAYANLLAASGETAEAGAFERMAAYLMSVYNETWWNDELGRFSTSIIQDGTFDTTHVPLLQILPLYFGIVDAGDRRERLIDNLKEGSIVEVNGYLTEVYYQNGRDELGFQYLMRQLDPQLPRREYPENPFTAVGTIVHRLMGVAPSATERVVETRSRLPEAVSWARIQHVPLLRNQITVRHAGHTETRFDNESGPVLRWRAVMRGAHAALIVDGERVDATIRHTARGEPESFVLLEVGERQSRMVMITPE
jgi:hypothetical protein